MSALEQVAPLLKLDLGCGKHKREGFTGVDCIAFDGVDVITDLTNPWPWPDNSVEEVNASHFLEHLDATERIHFVNELYRVLVPNGKATIAVPHWASGRAYGDITHKWPPVAEFWFYYLDKNWRADNAPHNDFYVCDFGVVWGYTLHDLFVRLSVRSDEVRAVLQTFGKEVAQDMIATFTARK